MTRKCFICPSLIFCLLLVSWMSAETISRPPATSRDGLKVTQFSLTAREFEINSPFSLEFRLKNVTDHDIKFHENYGVFFGVRLEDDNRDCGHDYRGYVLHPGQSIILRADCIFDQPGTWTFWPAYHTNGHWGPYKWNAIVVEIPD
jgi:hypothetical protein